ncbi:MAG: hypothetical protein Q9209_002222 [Squamulea sp. 1 TL-2023]
MTTIQTIPQRKPATYGKPLRKPPAHCFEPSAFELYNPKPHSHALQSGIAASQDQDSRRHTEPHRHHRSSQKVGVPSSLKQSTRKNAASVSTGVIASQDLAKFVQERGTSKRHDIWDLSSSDEPEKGNKSDQADSKKRRRMSGLRPQSMASSNQVRHNTSTTHALTSKTTDYTTSIHHVEATGSLQPTITSRRAPMRVSRMSVQISPSKPGAAHGQRPSPKGAECTEHSLSPTPRTPTPKKSWVKDTTPHQQELWCMLLPGRTKLEPGNDSYDSSDPSLSKSTRSSTPEARPLIASKRRGRLIDKLQPATHLSQTCTTASSDVAVISSTNIENMPDLRKASPCNVKEYTLTSGIKPKATYSSQRSFLAAGELDDTTSFNVPLVDHEQKSREGLRTGTEYLDFGSPEGVQEGNSDGSQGSSMRTIHELRESGENVRHLNDIEALFDDLDGQNPASVSWKRRRLLDLVRRLHEPVFCRLLFDQGFDNRLLAQSESRDNDAIADALLAVAVLYLVATPSERQAASSSYNLRVADFFAAKLERDQDLVGLVRVRRSNLSKQDQSDLKGYFVDVLMHSSVWRSGAPTKLSMRLIALQGLEYLVRTRREAGCKTEILPPKIIQRLVQGLPSAYGVLKPNNELLLETRLAISVLESYTISGTNHDDQQWTQDTLRPVIAVLSWLSGRPDKGGEGTQKLTLRLYLNLTNNNPRLCEAFAGHEVLNTMLSLVESHFQSLSERKQGMSGSNVLDTLILALGTLINLVEWSTAVRDIMIGTIGQDGDFLETLVELFVARQEVVAEVKYSHADLEEDTDLSRSTRKKRPVQMWPLVICRSS